MRTVEEIKGAIRQLPQDQIFKLTYWLQAFEADLWDRQNNQKGELDFLIEEAKKEKKSGILKNFLRST